MTEEHVEEFVTRFADDEKLTRKDVEQAINYVVKNKSYKVVYSDVPKILYDYDLDTSNRDIDIHSRQAFIKLGKRLTKNKDKEIEESLSDLVLVVGVFGNPTFITIDDLLDKSLTDCVVDLISDVDLIVKEEIKMKDNDLFENLKKENENYLEGLLNSISSEEETDSFIEKLNCLDFSFINKLVEDYRKKAEEKKASFKKDVKEKEEITEDELDKKTKEVLDNMSQIIKNNEQTSIKNSNSNTKKFK